MNTPNRRTRPATDGSNRDPAEIEREIDATREEMSHTLDELTARLSPGQMLDKALHFVRANGGEFAHNLGDSVKQNPMPVVLAGVGLLWMMASSGRRESSSNRGGYYRDELSIADADAGSLDLAEADAGTIGMPPPGSSSLGEKVSGAAASARHAAGAAREKISGMAGRVSGTAHSVSGRVHGAAYSAGYRARQARQGFSQLMDEQPLLVGALGVALGALIGATLPPTETEDRVLGPQRDRGLDRAKETAREQYARAREYASDAMENRPVNPS